MERAALKLASFQCAVECAPSLKASEMFQVIETSLDHDPEDSKYETSVSSCEIHSKGNKLSPLLLDRLDGEPKHGEEKLPQWRIDGVAAAQLARKKYKSPRTKATHELYSAFGIIRGEIVRVIAGSSTVCTVRMQNNNKLDSTAAPDRLMSGMAPLCQLRLSSQHIQQQRRTKSAHAPIGNSPKYFRQERVCAANVLDNKSGCRCSVNSRGVNGFFIVQPV
ncbi:hypothetical protein B0H14DRAFT_2618002 [Mycena olivaceomarginata]|nr:hypothetical protein B0H14DRAFT_2618002 [Mycena olivaceomarginata]